MTRRPMRSTGSRRRSVSGSCAATRLRCTACRLPSRPCQASGPRRLRRQPLKDEGMTTELDRAEAKRPRGISRIDPALRAAAAGLELTEFRTESLPGERERANRLAADRAAAVDATDVHIEDRAVAGPDGEQLVLRLYRGVGHLGGPAGGVRPRRWLRHRQPRYRPRA